jgi:hypothetical protein
MASFQPPPEKLPRPKGELEQWIQACRGGPGSQASFERAYPFAETILIGTIAQRVERRLSWDTDRMEFPGAPEANALMRRRYREGWEL